MQEIADLIYAVVFFVFDLVSIVAALGGVYLVFVTGRTMLQNRSLRWDTTLVAPILLFAFAYLLQFVPSLYVRSFRIGLEAARPEAQALKEELKEWLPSNEVVITGSTPVMVTPIPTATHEPTVEATYTPIVVSETLPVTPKPVTPEPTPTLAPTMVPTIDVSAWNVQTPAPTPLAGGN